MVDSIFFFIGIVFVWCLGFYCLLCGSFTLVNVILVVFCLDFESSV